jgi:predicted dinucleotide-binding enzyme
MVGRALGSKLVSLGHEVMMGSRENNNPGAAEWVAKAGARASQGTFATAASFGEVVILCAKGEVALEVAQQGGEQNLAGKVLLDVSNPLDSSRGMPLTLIAALSNTNSLGEELQRRYPKARVVKALNTVNCEVMVNPDMLAQPTDVFVSGDDAEAKQLVTDLLKSFGWQRVVDLGGIATARGTEMFLPIWLSLWSKLGTPHFNIQIVAKPVS